MKFSIWKKLTLVILAAAIALCGSGCRLRSNEERFDEYTAEIFRQMLSGDTLSAHFIVSDLEKYGISTDTVSFGQVLPDASLQGNMTWEQSVDSQIKMLEFMFNYDKLTEAQQLTYDQLMHYLNASRNYGGLEYYNSYCVGSNSVVTNLPLMLAEFEFRTQKDIDCYLALLDTYDEYFSQIIQYEQERSNRGLFMADASLDGFQEKCNQFLESGEENVLLLSFEDRISVFEGLDETSKETYIAKNKNLVETVVMPAYQSLSAALEQLRGTGKAIGGICQLPKGKQYYEYWVGRTVGSSMTIDEMYTALATAMNTYQAKIMELSNQDPDLLQKITAFSFRYDTPEDVMEHLKEATKEDYPALQNVNYTIKSIPSYLSNTNVAGFYILSPVDAVDHQIIYMNDAKLFTDEEVFTTLAHEGYPGHLYQTVYSLRDNPNPLRYALGTTGYKEGWTTYVEKESYHYCGIQDENLVLALQLNNVYNTLFSAYLDIAVNYKGMDFQTFYNMLKSMGIEESTARTAYQAYTEDPGIYLPYAIGFLEIEALRQQAEETLGEKFVLKEFHETILDLGSVPFPLLEKHVNAWLAEATLLEDL